MQSDCKCVCWEERETDKKTFFALFLVLAFLSTMCFRPTVSAPPTIKRPMQIIEATINGAAPYTVDPAAAYDTASGELIQNVYDTLITFNGERIDTFLPSLATSWVSEDITGTVSPEGLPWYYRYVFEIRTGVQFQGGSLLTPSDVEYSFEREMVMDIIGGPQWMLYEPLLNNAGGAAALGDIGSRGFPGPDISRVGRMIDEAVESNATHVWFNLAFPGAYAPFIQILCETWSSIISRQWVNTYVIGTLGRPDWSGDWFLNGDHTDWINYWNPEFSPLDNPTPIMNGAGPFALEYLDYTLQTASLQRYMGYWRGWPVDFPVGRNSVPQGYVNQFIITWAYDWLTGKTMFLAGDIDMIAVPRAKIPEMYQNPDPPYGRPNYPLDGVRCIPDLPVLSCDALFFTYDINLTTPYGPVGPPGVFDPSLIPSDFFSNPIWGSYVRKGLAYAFDYGTYIQTTYLGEATHPATAIVPGLNDYDGSVDGYYYDLNMARAEFQSVPSLWETGFNITFVARVSSPATLTACTLLASALQSLNPLFTCNVVSVGFGSSYIRNVTMRNLPVFQLGWLADYPDAHNFAWAFYSSAGSFAGLQGYNNPVMDELISEGIAAPEGPARQAICTQIEQLAIDDCPSTAITQTFGRHFERDWLVGWYYNPAYSGIYAPNLWKWYYVAQYLQSSLVQPISSLLPLDINYDGKCDLRDIVRVIVAYHSVPGDPKWDFRVDVNNDRKIDGRDLGYVAKYFANYSPVWAPT